MQNSEGSTQSQQHSGATARSLCTPDDPFLIVVEDVNRADQPALLIERIAAWGSENNQKYYLQNPSWQLLCPVWPKILSTVTDEARKCIEGISVHASVFSQPEAAEAVQRKATLDNVRLSLLEAQSIAVGLGNDPLLIALYDFINLNQTNDVIAHFVAAAWNVYPYLRVILP
jgi:hypothetical protein